MAASRTPRTVLRPTMTPLAVIGIQVAQQSTQTMAAAAELAMAQVQASRASENAPSSAPKPAAANPLGVGGLVDQTA
jgi:tartrate dehydratase alpha subunit/fumarate hydratase class I-like protein